MTETSIAIFHHPAWGSSHRKQAPTRNSGVER